MEKKYLLPVLTNDIEVDTKECWETRDEAYDYLIRNLLLSFDPNASVFEGGSNAVPHIFEQMLMFHKAYFDDRHPDHNRAVMEWRAVLSIMALQRVCNVQVDLVRVELSGESSSPFLRAAYNFRPEDAPVFFNTTWEFLYILRLKKIPIALFSPVTLVCPAKMFLKKVNKNLDNNWLSILKVGGSERLVFNFQGMGRELSELQKWLNTLKYNLRSSGISGKSEDKYKKVIRNLKQFADECISSAEEDGENPLRDRIYNSINTNIRKEYDFLNNCCDVRVKNRKLNFLVERYMEDVFDDNVLILVYDRAPDTMERVENIHKLEELYRNILSIENNKTIIEVYDNGGRRKAACVFLPFKSRFVSELIQNKITPSEFFGRFSAIYHPVTRQLEVVLQIKGFPYSFRKKYSADSWQYLCGTDLEATYIWPKAQLDSVGWKNYYIYTEELKDTGVEVSVPEAVSQVKYIYEPTAGRSNMFQLCKSHSFPAYLCYTYQGVSGYLPIWTTHLGTDEIGSTASIIVDLGHATTSISIIKEHGGDVQQETRKTGQDVCFWSPRSRRIAGSRGEINAVNMNFVISDEEKSEEVNGCIKNMMHSFRKYNRVPVIEKERRPFEDGQILFDSSAYTNDFQESIVSYINFEYALMDQVHREKVHIFIEQLLVYAVYQIIIQKCSYVRVYFLHGYREGDTRLGELKGLWNNALINVKRRTGINSAGSEDTIAVKEYEALGYYVYGQVYKENLAGDSSVCPDNINMGVNIGWKNTNVVILSTEGEGQAKVNVEYTRLEYAGRNISMLADADNSSLNMPAYPKILQILLGGQNLDQKQDIKKMLLEFSQLFNNQQKDVTHYQGVFDAIAMKIDEEGYSISPDVFNNTPEFRYYVMAVTYNIMLLFLGIGAILKKGNKKAKQVNLYLGGNGAKFLKWVSNDKDFREIHMSDAHELFILPMQSGILEYLALSAGWDINKVEIRIILVDKPEEQLIQGCRIKLFEKDIELPRFCQNSIDRMLDSVQYTDFIELMKNMRQEIFADFPGLSSSRGDGSEGSNESQCDDGSENVNSGGNGIPHANYSVEQLMENERKQVCGEIIKEITYIDNNPYVP